MLKRSDFYVADPDPQLPHQISLWWIPGSLKIGARCNCGHPLGTHRPERGEVVPAVKSRYDAHVEAVLKAQAHEVLAQRHRPSSIPPQVR